jgi:hypothetical protein
VTVREVSVHARTREFHVQIGDRTYPFPFARAEPVPTPNDPVVAVAIDPEIAREGFTYQLASGREGTIHGEQVLEHNSDPALLRDRALYFLSVEAQRQLAASGRAKRDVIRQLGTSASQFYRLLDQTNYRKSIDQMVALLGVLGCEVDIAVRPR